MNNMFIEMYSRLISILMPKIDVFVLDELGERNEESEKVMKELLEWEYRNKIK